MARTLKWRDRVREIRDRVKNSVVETWSRRDIENVFDLKRAAAQQLMKAIGDVQNIGGVHLVDRNSLLAFLDQIDQADNPEAARREKLQLAEPVPRPQHLKNTLPEGLRSVMVRDLPAEIILDRGRLEVVGKNSDEIFSRLLLLAQAIQNDTDTAAEMLDPPPVHRSVENDELTELFADLRRREQEFALRGGLDSTVGGFLGKPTPRDDRNAGPRLPNSTN
jgi:hypothetical protein